MSLDYYVVAGRSPARICTLFPYTTLFRSRYEAVPDSFRRADGTVVPLQYIVEPEYAPYAYLIFGETPRMIEVFEDRLDRKSTRLNSSHVATSYAVFCLKKTKSSHQASHHL